MSAIIIYEKFSPEELQKAANEVIPQITSWFEKNPKRLVCRTELWYGKYYSIKRRNVAKQINDIVDKLSAPRR